MSSEEKHALSVSCMIKINKWEKFSHWTYNKSNEQWSVIKQTNKQIEVQAKRWEQLIQSSDKWKKIQSSFTSASLQCWATVYVGELSHSWSTFSQLNGILCDKRHFTQSKKNAYGPSLSSVRFNKHQAKRTVFPNCSERTISIHQLTFFLYIPVLWVTV